MKRESKNLASSLEHRLSGYALAASAAGVGVLALAQPADAKIVYTKANVQIGYGLLHFYKLDLNDDGHTDISFSFSSTCKRRCSSTRYETLFVAPRRNAVAESGHPLRRGTKIGRNQRFNTDTQTMLQVMGSCSRTTQGGYTCRTHSVSGGWLNVTDHYVGLKFSIHGKTHYGWARFNVLCSPKTGINATLTGYAYETIPNKPIIAGKTKGPDVITLQAPNLGHLARGASAIPAWRGVKSAK
jgi:hypothetical protein